jgi:hypothetical protein
MRHVNQQPHRLHARVLLVCWYVLLVSGREKVRIDGYSHQCVSSGSIQPAIPDPWRPHLDAWQVDILALPQHLVV